MELLVAVESEQVKYKPDGSLDFGDAFVPEVADGELLAQYPLAERAPGTEKPLLTAGDNVRLAQEGALGLMVATVEGVPVVSDNRLSVVKRLVLPHGVNYKTGNLEYEGDILVLGPVMPGYTVRAEGNVTVLDSVMAGVEISAGGSIRVGKDVLGHQTKLDAKGPVWARLAQEAKVYSGADIVLGQGARHARLHSGGMIRVGSAEGGGIEGGKSYALHGIETAVAGSLGRSSTLLVAGITPEIAGRMEKIETALQKTSKQVLRMLENLGLSRIDMVQIRKMINAAGKINRKALVYQFRKLGQMAQIQRQLLGQRDQLRAQTAEGVERVRVTIAQRAYPGVEVRLSGHRKQVNLETRSLNFHIKDNVLLER